MQHEDVVDAASEYSSQYEDNDSSTSDVEYPLINLKNGLSNDLKENRQKDIEKCSNKTRKGSKFKSTEFSREVIGHNKMVQFQMAKTVNYYFSEFDYLREKIKRAQQKTLEQLKEIHLDKRKQIRESYKYHNEEMRYAIQRMKEEKKFQIEQEELEDRMRRRERSIARLSLEQKKMMKEAYLNEQAKITKKSKKKEEDTDQDNKSSKIGDSVPKIEPLKSRSFLLAGALEVTKDAGNPRTTKRSMDYIESYEVQDSRHLPEETIVTDMVSINQSIEEVKNTNQIDMDPIPNVKDGDNDVRIKVEDQRKTAVEIMKERKRRKAMEVKKIVDLPYNVYRRNSKGKLQKVDHPLPKSQFKEPSNKDKYKIRKELSTEREKYQNYISELAKTTEMIIQEDIKITRQLDAPELKLTKESVGLPQRRIGAKDWMRAFVSSNIPDDIDPSSTEAIIYCRYIRAPLHKYSHLPNYKLYHTPL